tara:strand:- start:49 stop:165 length:117 start_codon:yes stop_codon:yes gene_type:complete
MIIKIITRHGEYIDIQISEKPKYIPVDVEVVELGIEEE